MAEKKDRSKKIVLISLKSLEKVTEKGEVTIACSNGKKKEKFKNLKIGEDWNAVFQTKKDKEEDVIQFSVVQKTDKKKEIDLGKGSVQLSSLGLSAGTINTEVPIGKAILQIEISIKKDSDEADNFVVVAEQVEDDKKMKKETSKIFKQSNSKRLSLASSNSINVPESPRSLGGEITRADSHRKSLQVTTTAREIKLPETINKKKSKIGLNEDDNEGHSERKKERLSSRYNDLKPKLSEDFKKDEELINKLRGEIEELKLRNVQYERDIESSKTDVKSRSKEIKKLKTEAHARLQTHMVQSDELIKLKEENGLLQERLKSHVDDRETDEQLQQLKEKLEEFEKHNEVLKMTLKDLNERLTGSLSQLEETRALEKEQAEQIQILKNTITDASNANQALQRENDRIESVLVDSANTVTELKESLSEKQKELDDFMRRYNVMEVKMKEVGEEIPNINIQHTLKVNEMNVRIREKEEEIGNWKKEVGEKSALVEKYASQVKGLADSIDSIKAEKDSLAQELSESNKLMKQYQREVREKNAELETALERDEGNIIVIKEQETRISALNAQVEELNTNVHSLVTKLTETVSLKSENEEKSELELVEKESKINSLKATLNDRETQIGSLENTLIKVKVSEQSLRDELEQITEELSKEKSKLQQEILDSNSKLKEKENVINSLHQQMIEKESVAESEKRKLAATSKILEEEKSALQTKLDTKEIEISKLNEAFLEFKSKSENVEKELELKKNQLKKLNSEVEEKEVNYKKVVKEKDNHIETLNIRVTSILESSKKFEKEIDILSSKLKNTRAENEEIQKKFEEGNMKLKNLEEELVRVKEREQQLISNGEKTQHKFEEDIKTLNIQLTKITTESKTNENKLAEEIKHLKASEKQLNNEFLQKKKEIEEMSKSLQESKNLLEIQKVSENLAKEKMTRLESEYQRLNNLMNSAEKATAESEHFSNTIKSLESELQKETSEKSALQINLLKSQQEVESFKTKVSELEERVNTYLKENEKLRTEIEENSAESNNTNKTLEDSVTNLQKLILQKDTVISDLTDERARDAKLKEKLELSIKEKSELVERLKSEKESLETINRKLNSEITDKVSELTIEKSEKTVLNNTVAEISEKLKATKESELNWKELFEEKQKDLEKMEERYNKKKDKVRHHKEKHSHLEKSLHSKHLSGESEKLELWKQLESLKTQKFTEMREYQKKLEDANNNMDDLNLRKNAEIKELQKQIEFIAMDKKELEIKIEMLTSEKDNFKKISERLTENEKEWNSTRISLEQDVENLKEELLKKNLEIKNLEEHKDKAQKELHTVRKDEKSNLEGEVTQLHKKFNESQFQFESLKLVAENEKKEFKRKLERLTAELEEESTQNGKLEELLSLSNKSVEELKNRLLEYQKSDSEFALKTIEYEKKIQDLTSKLSVEPSPETNAIIEQMNVELELLESTLYFMSSCNSPKVSTTNPDEYVDERTTFLIKALSSGAYFDDDADFGFLGKIIDVTRQAYQRSSNDINEIAFWLKQTTYLYDYFAKFFSKRYVIKKFGINIVVESADEIPNKERFLNELLVVILEIYKVLLALTYKDLGKLLIDVAFQTIDEKVVPETRVSQSKIRQSRAATPKKPPSQAPTPSDITRLLSQVLSILDNHTLDLSIMIQYFNQIFHFIDGTIFNELMTNVAKYSVAERGFFIKLAASEIENWGAINIEKRLKKQENSPFQWKGQLSHVIESGTVLVLDKILFVDDSLVKELFPSLTGRQLHRLLSKFQPSELCPNPVPKETLKHIETLIPLNSSQNPHDLTIPIALLALKYT